MNLKNGRRVGRIKGIHWFLVGLSAAVLALGIRFATDPDAMVARPLGLEERQVLHATFDRLGGKVPELSQWIEVVDDLVADESLPVALDPAGAELLSWKNDLVSASPRFFEADSGAQEIALLRLVFDIQHSSRLQEGELALSGTE